MTSPGNSFLYVTYIEKQGPFIKIWGQTDRTSPAMIKKTLSQLSQIFDEGHHVPQFENILLGNVMYCAKYVDGSYYRVWITNMQQNLLEVFFPDFGNTEVVSIMSLRMIPNLASGLITHPAQAKDFILANVTHQGLSWDASTFSLISNEIRFTEATYSVVSQVGNTLLIKLFKNITEDLALSLFNRGIVLSIALNAQHMIIQNTTSGNVPVPMLQSTGGGNVSMLQNTRASVPMPSIPPVSAIERQTPSPISRVRALHSTTSPTPPQPTILTYKGAIIEPGSEYCVYVSYVCDGPCQFSIQLQKSEDNLVKLMKELNSMTLQPLEEFPMPGTVCVARCVEDDHICRAVVTNMVDSQYKVFYVDFGNTEVVPIENLFQIPFKYVIPKVMATRYALAGLNKSSVTVEMKCAFKEFVCDKLLRMQALAAPARSALPLCNLYDDNNINVLDVLKRVAVLAYPETTQLNRGFSHEVHVSYVHSCSRFYVQIKGKEQDLTNLMNTLQQVCANGQSLQTVKVGLPCCALFEDDGQWYRSQITHIEGTNVRVRYVDYGNEAVVAPERLVKPPGELVTALRPQAVECCLIGYQNMEDDLERDNALEQLILEQDFTMKVIEMQNNRAIVEIFDSSRNNVNCLLLDQMTVSKLQVSPILIQENNQIEPRKKKSIDESSNFNRNDRKPLRDQNERGFDRQDSWRQSKPQRKDDDFDKPQRDNTEKPWRDNMNKAHDTFDKPHRDSFDKPPRREKFENSHDNRDKVDTWDEDKSNSNWKSNQKDGFGKNSFDDNKSGSWKSNSGGFKKDGDSNSNWKSGNRDGFKKNDQGDSDWKSKPKENDDWGNSEKSERPNRFNKFNDDNRKPRDNKPFSGGRKDSWGSSDTTSEKRVMDPAPFTTAFLSDDLLNRNEKVVVSWFHDPVHFFCQMFDTQTEFKTMMEDIQSHYCNIKPSSAPLGSSVIALFPDDSVLYRARILEVMGSQYRVQYVDFGNVSNTDKVWPVEKKFMKLAAQAICCGLNGIIPIGETWPSSSSFSSYFDKEYYYSQFVSYDDNTYAVEMTHDGVTSISGDLISVGLAQYSAEPEVFDPSILLGQQIKVTLRDVHALDSFNVELPNGVLLLCTMHNLTTATETFEDVLKQLADNFVLMYIDNVLEDKVEVTLYDTTGTKLTILQPDEGAFEVLEIPSQLPVLYSTINGSVSHIQTEEDVQSIYIQPADYADALALLLENMFNRYEGVPCGEPVQPEVNTIYAVHSSDTNWYRGEVKTVEDDSVLVRYIDYGNSETLQKSELRNLDSEFFDQHILALTVSAAGVDESFLEQYVTGTVWYGENGWEAELQIQPTEEPAEQVDVIESEENAVACAEEVTTSEIIEPVQQIGVTVVLSHADTPNEFYLQQFDSLETIDNLQASLQEQALDYPNLENPATGSLCAAPYSLDQQWYRAQILDADEDITTVRFVDYGNTDVITNDTTNVKTLPPELLALEQYARRSSLMIESNEPEWSSAAFERFQQLTDVEHLTVEIIHQDEKTTYVQLYANGIDVADTLIQEALAKKLQLEIESSCTGYVSNLNSPSEFWIQLENSVADLEWVAEQLSSATTFSETEDLTPGSLCAALFPEDEMWYRARILSNTVAGLEVVFIDYGNSCTCISLRQLPEDLIMLPPLAQKCSLQKPPGILQWGQQAIDEFKTVSADGATVFNIDKVSTGETNIVRLLLNGEDISDNLLPLTEDACISYFESATSFWITKLSDTSKLVLIDETLTDANEWQQYDENQEGCEFVAALNSEDESWYRARIVSKGDSDYEVFYIDYGNSGRVTEVRLLSCDTDKESPLAVKCRLEPLPGYKWSEESTKTLSEISNGGSTSFQVEFVGGDVVRLYLNGCDIRSKLESTPVPSAPTSPKKSVLQPNETVHIPEENNESVELAESIRSQIQNCLDNAITSKEACISTETSEDHAVNGVDNSTEVAKIILRSIEDTLFNDIVAKDVSTEDARTTELDKATTNQDYEDKLVNGFVESASESLISNTVDINDTEVLTVCEDYEEKACNDEVVQDNLKNLQIDNKQTDSDTQLNHEDISPGDLVQRRLSIPYSEKIVPGSVCRGVLDNNELDDCNECQEVVSDSSVSGYYTPECVTQELNTEVDSTDLIVVCAIDDIGVDAPKPRVSLPYPEKIVPGAISRGDLSVAGSETEPEKIDDIPTNQSKKESKEQLVPGAESESSDISLD